MTNRMRAAVLLGNTFFGQRDLPKARAEFAPLIPQGESVLAANPAAAELRHWLAEAHVGLGLTHRSVGDNAAYLEQVQLALILFDADAPEDKRDREWRYLHASALSNLGDGLQATPRFEEGLLHMRTAADELDRLSAEFPEQRLYLRQAMLTWSHIADALAGRNDEAGALDAARKFVEIARKRQRDDPADEGATGDLGIALYRLSERLSEQAAERSATLEEAISLLRSIVTRNSKNAQIRSFLASADVRIGEILRSRQPARAVSHWNEAVSVTEPLLSTGIAAFGNSYLSATRYLADDAISRGNPAAAENLMSKVSAARAGLETTARPSPQQALLVLNFRSTEALIGARLGAAGARQAVLESISGWAQESRRTPLTAAQKKLLAELQSALGRTQ